MKRNLLLLLVCIGLVVYPRPMAAEGAAIKLTTADGDPTVQTAALFKNEARAVYLGNLERRKAGLPPLRWNRELTLAARWFGWDSIENRPANWIGHDDTQGGMPGDRAFRWGYRGAGGAENAGRATYLLSSADSIGMWMNSDGHRRNLLDSGHTEIGFGYYSNGDTYTVQDFGADAAYAPLVIENEKPETTARTVNLYQYSPKAGSITAMGPARQMMVSTSKCFTGAAWQAYATESAFTLPSTTAGWKTVYSKIKDSLGRTATSSDMIYYGGTAPATSYNLNQLSRRLPSVSLYGLSNATYPYAQFSLGWMADDGSPDFKKWWGAGSRVKDSAAKGGTAYRMTPGDGETMAWVTSYGWLNQSAKYVAYFRVKTNSRASSGEVARIAVEANGRTTQVSIAGTKFSAADKYQEFAVPFTYDNKAADKWLKFIVWRSGNANITFDSVAIFTAPRTYTATYKWAVPGGNYRGQGVWVRYSNATGSRFTGYKEARLCP